MPVTGKVQLVQAGCEKIYKETQSGGKWARTELQACLKHLRQGDVRPAIKWGSTIKRTVESISCTGRTLILTNLIRCRTRDDRLRQPVFLGIREAKSPTNVVREKAS